MFKLLRNLILLALIGGGVAAYFLIRPGGVTIEVPQSKLQSAVEGKFPVSKSKLLVLTLNLSDPQIELKSGENKLFVRTRSEVTLLGSNKLLSGTSVISAGVDFDREKGTFYLTNVTFQKVEIDGVPDALNSAMDEIGNALARKSLEKLEISKIEEGTTQGDATKLLLKKVEVRDGKLLLTLGL